MTLSVASRLEKQRKKLHKEYLLKDLKDDKEEKLEKVACSAIIHVMMVNPCLEKFSYMYTTLGLDVLYIN